jgi:polyhydroxyalkanoate synthase
METRGENLLKGLEHMLRDLGKGQLTQTDQRVRGRPQPRDHAGQGGQAHAALPAHPVHADHDEVYEDAADHLPALDQPLLHPRPQPEEELHPLGGRAGADRVHGQLEVGRREPRRRHARRLCPARQIDAIDTVRDLLGVESVHTIGYCVAGTTLAATLALLEARARRTRSQAPPSSPRRSISPRPATSSLFLGDEQMQLIQQLSAEKGYLDGRYMAATFNLLRGRDLIWNYVTNNYLLGEEPPPFDLLHWNGDTTNLPAKWHRAYLERSTGEQAGPAGGITIDGTPIDLTKVKTPTYVQAGREDHIAPPQSVWKITHHFQGPLRFVLAGSGHIAGVVNPPEARNTNIGSTRISTKVAGRSTSSSRARPRPRAAGGPTGGRCRRRSGRRSAGSAGRRRPAPTGRPCRRCRRLRRAPCRCRSPRPW